MKYREEGKWVELTNENYFKLSKEQLIIALGTIIMEHKKAQLKIERAIEEINKNKYMIDIGKVLEILRGKDNE